MDYILAHWLHDSSTYPVLLYSELSEDRYEARKVEVYVDGRVGLAGPDLEHGDTRLGVVPVPHLGEINSLGEFQAREINHTEFEAIWHLAHRAAGLKQ